MQLQQEFGSLQGKRVLLVEQDDRLCCALRGALQDAGCEIRELATHFDDISEVVPRSRLDAALIDTSWRGMPLVELVGQLAERHVPMLWIGGVSASLSRRRTSEVIELSKPFTELELLDCMRQAVNATSLPTGMKAASDAVPLPG